jgi:hypothetical protein
LWERLLYVERSVGNYEKTNFGQEKFGWFYKEAVMMGCGGYLLGSWWV